MSYDMWDISSLTRTETHVPCFARRILYYWTTREVSNFSFLPSLNNIVKNIFVHKFFSLQSLNFPLGKIHKVYLLLLLEFLLHLYFYPVDSEHQCWGHGSLPHQFEFDSHTVMWAGRVTNGLFIKSRVKLGRDRWSLT